MSSKTDAKTIKHPYFPRSLKLKNYVPNEKGPLELAGITVAIALAVIIVTWILSGKRKEQFSFKRRLVLAWFLQCALTHIVLEGYLAIYHATIAGRNSFLAEIWKEFSKSDSRYLTSDTHIVCIESIVAVITGPLAFTTFFAFLQGSIHRYAFQILLSVCQLYGHGLYCLSEIKEGFVHGPGPNGNPIHFYGYAVGLNSIWLVMPAVLIIDAFQHMGACQRVSDFYIDQYNKKQLNHIKKS